MTANQPPDFIRPKTGEKVNDNNLTPSPGNDAAPEWNAGFIRQWGKLRVLLPDESGIMPIVGSTNPQRIREAARAAKISLSREEWYRLFTAARGESLP